MSSFGLTSQMVQRSQSVGTGYLTGYRVRTVVKKKSLNPLTGGFFLCFRWVFSLGKKKIHEVSLKKNLYKIHLNFKLHILYIESKEIKCLLEKGGYLHYFHHMWKQYRLDLLGLGNALLSSKSLSLDLDSPSSF